MSTVRSISRRLIGRLPWLAAALGLALGLWLVLRQDPGRVLDVLLQAGWSLLWIVPFHLLPLLLDALGWRRLLLRHDLKQRLNMSWLLWVCCVREGVARLMPLASVGGELIGVRLLLLRGFDGAVATASVVAQMLVSLLNQYLFAVLGVLLMLGLGADAHFGRLVLLGLLLSLPLPAAAWLLLHHGRPFERVEGLLQRFVGDRSGSLPAFDGGAVDSVLRGYFRQPGQLLGALLWELAGMTLGAFENWWALRLLGHAVSPAEALALEAATQALRHLFFMVPGSLGVQEAALLLFGSVFGLPPDLAIALSLAKRLRELLLGLPSLLSWQWLELRRLRRR